MHDSLGLYEVWKLCVSVIIAVTVWIFVARTKRAAQMLFASSLSPFVKADTKFSVFIHNIAVTVAKNAVLHDELEKIDSNAEMRPHFAQQAMNYIPGLGRLFSIVLAFFETSEETSFVQFAAGVL